ncbi:hypothetical protein BGZ76_005322 [Entomortierella beljakovae]|nr:hypothetical protein BGZ76_005322 [Entomortierella beljakovae]
MTTRFLDMALDEVAKSRATNNRSPNPRRGGGPNRGGNSSGRDSPNRSNRSSPYNRPQEDRWTHDKFDESGQRNSGGGGGARNNDNQRPQNNSGNAKIIVENLHYAVTLEDIKELFDTHAGPVKVSLPDQNQNEFSKDRITIACHFVERGTIIVDKDQLISTGMEEIRVVMFAEVKYDPSGRSTGAATILFKDPADAAKAIKKLNGVTLDEQAMKITYAPLPVGSPRGQDRRQGPSAGAGGPKRDVFSRLGSSEADIASRLGRPNPVPRPNVGRPQPSQNQGRKQQGGNKPREKKLQPKTAEELDAEMDTYMADVS